MSSGILESPSHLLRKCQPPLARGPLEEQRTDLLLKAPLAKGGRAAGRSPVAGGFRSPLLKGGEPGRSPVAGGFRSPLLKGGEPGRSPVAGGFRSPLQGQAGADPLPGRTFRLIPRIRTAGSWPSRCSRTRFVSSRCTQSPPAGRDAGRGRCPPARPAEGPSSPSPGPG